MALTKLTADVENIQALSDKPNEIGGLTADQLKAKFDKAGSNIKTYINDTLTAEIDALITATKLAINPIGTIVMNITNTNPSTYIGGTWTAWGAGRVPVGVDTGDANFNTVEKEVGESTVTLTAAQSGLPSHEHIIDYKTFYTYTSGTLEAALVAAGTGMPSATRKSVAANASEAHNNIQKSITCYFFKRTA